MDGIPMATADGSGGPIALMRQDLTNMALLGKGGCGVVYQVWVGMTNLALLGKGGCGVVYQVWGGGR